MSKPEHPPHRVAVAVIMERTALRNRWVSEQWGVKGVVRDDAPAGAASRVIVESGDTRQVLFPGCEIRLRKHEAEGYYLNITAPQPRVFVMWRMQDDGTPRPERLTASYDEGARWMDSGEQVEGVALPPELLGWLADFVEQHYVPEPPKRKRYASSRDRGRMGRSES